MAILLFSVLLLSIQLNLCAFWSDAVPVPLNGHETIEANHHA
jgi:hypothetical protein